MAVQRDDHSIHVRRSLEYYLHRHFESSKPLVTAESGRGPFTETFLNRTQQHFHLMESETGKSTTQPHGISFDWSRAGASETIIANFQTFPSQRIETKVDIFYLGGSHRFPVSSIILQFAIEHLADGGVLVLPNVDVPSTNFIYSFLQEHSQFNLHLTMENTAFFGFSQINDIQAHSWMDQGFNIQNYPAHDPFTYNIPFRIPFNLGFDGYYVKRSSEIERGFRINRGKLITEGHFSKIRFPVAAVSGDEIDVEITLRPIGLSGRPNARIDVHLCNHVFPQHRFFVENDASFRATVSPDEAGFISVHLFNNGLVPASEIGLGQDGYPSFSRPGVELVAISACLSESDAYKTKMKRHEGSVVSFDYEGQSFNFFVDNRHDSIQAHHHAGAFYEEEELKLIGRYIKAGSKILDVGANIGNHAVYFEKVLSAKRVVVIELQPRVIALLKLNIALNQLVNTDTSRLGVGFGANYHKARIEIPQAFNVAGAQFKTDDVGNFHINPGDDVVANEVFDFIKIDVEGMECEVIEGLRSTISRCRPILFVEVWNENKSRFDELIAELEYELVDEFSRYEIATNLLLRPRHGA